MTVLFVFDRYEVGGITTLVATICSHLSRSGVTCVVAGGESPEFERVRGLFAGAILHTFPCPATSGIGHASVAWYAFRCINRICQTEKPDIIHANTTVSGVGALLAARIHAIPMLNHFHGAWDLEVASMDAYFRSVKNQLKNGDEYSLLPPNMPQTLSTPKSVLRYRLQQIVLSGSDTIICHSAYSARMLQTHFFVRPHKIRMMPAFLDISKQRYGSRSKARKTLGIPPFVKVFSLIARPEPRKNIHGAIDAFLKARTGISAPSTLIIGVPGYDSDYIRHVVATTSLKLAQHHPPFLHAIPPVIFTVLGRGVTKKELLSASDFFLMASPDLETFGVTTIEALSSGVIVLGMPAGATPEILSRGGGLLSASSKPDEYTRLIRRAITLSSNTVDTLRKQGKAVASGYAADRILPQLIQIYRALCQNTTPAACPIQATVPHTL